MAVIDFNIYDASIDVAFMNATFCNTHKELFYIFDKRGDKTITMKSKATLISKDEDDTILYYQKQVRLPNIENKYFVAYYKITDKIAMVEIYLVYLRFVTKVHTYLIDLQDERDIKYVFKIMDKMSSYPSAFKKVNKVVFDNFIYRSWGGGVNFNSSKVR